ncbi:hypothetical protein PCL_01391 [Purpureocillium lilacinum]|uniref:Uncharacterized protein n=1 Tax=Purpureocillium lilacinum TaxID=33203 RepID=A0A2U3E3E3_PURLI|nr:hypothetical protein PCL_01391 [Purpureocillium lilacinum]
MGETTGADVLFARTKQNRHGRRCARDRLTGTQAGIASLAVLARAAINNDERPGQGSYRVALPYRRLRSKQYRTKHMDSTSPDSSSAKPSAPGAATVAPHGWTAPARGPPRRRLGLAEGDDDNDGDGTTRESERRRKQRVAAPHHSPTKMADRRDCPCSHRPRWSLMARSLALCWLLRRRSPEENN